MYQLLVVDDEYEIRNGLCKYFPWEETGFRVAGQVGSGQEALAFLANHPVDLVLCDIIMPVMSGLELAEKLRISYPSVRVCFLTAHKDFAFAQRAVSLNAIQYILKSASSAELLNIFRGIQQELDKTALTAAPVQSAAVPATLGSAPSRDEQLIREIREYVQTHFDTADLNTTAAAIYMSPNYVSRLFKQKTGQNFSDYLLSVRMEKALEFLSNPHNHIYEISEMLGYQYVKNFSRTFRSYYGISPREYRSGVQPRRAAAAIRRS